MSLGEGGGVKCGKISLGSWGAGGTSRTVGAPGEVLYVSVWACMPGTIQPPGLSPGLSSALPVPLFHSPPGHSLLCSFRPGLSIILFSLEVTTCPSSCPGLKYKVPPRVLSRAQLASPDEQSCCRALVPWPPPLETFSQMPWAHHLCLRGLPPYLRGVCACMCGMAWSCSGRTWWLHACPRVYCRYWGLGSEKGLF